MRSPTRQCSLSTPSPLLPIGRRRLRRLHPKAIRKRRNAPMMTKAETTTTMQSGAAPAPKHIRECVVLPVRRPEERIRVHPPHCQAGRVRSSHTGLSAESRRKVQGSDAPPHGYRTQVLRCYSVTNVQSACIRPRSGSVPDTAHITGCNYVYGKLAGYTERQHWVITLCKLVYSQDC